LAEGLFHDARRLRTSMGDEAFFRELNSGLEVGSGWGDLEAGWDAARFEAATEAPPLPPGCELKDLPESQRKEFEERALLIGLLIKTFFGSYDTQAGGHGEAFLSL